MQNKTLQMKRALRTALLVLLLSVAGMGKGYAGIIDTIGNIVYQFAGPNPASPYKYPYNAAVVIGHRFGIEATGELVIPDSVHWFGNVNSPLVPIARIHAGAFSGCSGLTSITLPNSLEEILHGAFRDCSGLTDGLLIPNSVLSIGAAYYSEWSGNVDPWQYGGAFEGCNFTSVTIKATAPPILSNEWSYYIDPFNNVPCSNLTVPCECIPVYESSEWHYHFTTIVEDCQATFTIGNLNYIVNSDGTTVTVTGHVDGTAATGSLVIPESVNYQGTSYPVTRIGDSAFMGCRGLTGSLTIGNSVTTIGRQAFRECNGFTGDLTIGNSVTTVDHMAFCGCGFTGNLTIGNSVNSIGNYAFAYSFFTGSLLIPNSVTSIGQGAFLNCHGFTGNLTIGNSVTLINEWAFYYCSGLTSVTILSDVPPTFLDNIFYDVPCTTLTVPCGCVSEYEASDWHNYFTTIEEDCGSHDVIIDESSMNGGNVSTSVTSTELGEEVQLTITPDEGMMLASLIVSNVNDPSQTVPVYSIGKNSLIYGFIMPPFDVIITATFGPATAIGENNVALALVYPNPANGQVKIEAENIKNITINNMLGQTIYECNASGNAFGYDFSKHKAGIYLIRIETANGVAVKKVSVTR